MRELDQIIKRRRHIVAFELLKWSNMLYFVVLIEQEYCGFHFVLSVSFLFWIVSSSQNFIKCRTNCFSEFDKMTGRQRALKYLPMSTKSLLLRLSVTFRYGADWYYLENELSRNLNTCTTFLCFYETINDLDKSLKRIFWSNET